MPKGDPLVGRVLCDDLVKLCRDELKRDVGALSAPTMARVRAGLCHAIAIQVSVAETLRHHSLPA